MTDKTETPAAKAADALDHDHDGRKGGSAPIPERQPLLVVKDDARRGLVAGEVIRVADRDVKPLHSAGVARNATDVEVELAQPRVRDWSPPDA